MMNGGRRCASSYQDACIPRNTCSVRLTHITLLSKHSYANGTGYFPKTPPWHGVSRHSYRRVVRADGHVNNPALASTARLGEQHA